MVKIPEYRVRVFLSVDLVGSTAYKANLKSTVWIRTFRTFYTQFLSTFRSTYIEFCEEHEECAAFKERIPKLWKTIGDEAVFVNKVDSLFQLFAYVHSFDRALELYKKLLEANEDTSSLGVKANGWLASFPWPNQTIAMDDSEVDGFEDALPDESDEAGADSDPGRYEFLGPGIDSGFRIATNSSAGFFTLSPALAYALCRANTNRDYAKFRFDLQYRGVNPLKGVLSGASYPIVGLNTERNQDRVRLSKLQNILEGVSATSDDQMIEYLEEFIKFHKIELPPLELNGVDSKVVVPDFYTKRFIPDWEALKRDLELREANLNESAEVDENSEGTESETSKIFAELIKGLDKLSHGFDGPSD